MQSPTYARDAQRAQAAAAGYTAESAPCAVRQTHITEEMGLLENSADELASVVQALEDRLGSVLDSAGPSGEDAPPDTFRVPLAAGIRSERRRIQAYTDRLRSVLNRVEL